MSPRLGITRRARARLASVLAAAGLLAVASGIAVTARADVGNPGAITVTVAATFTLPPPAGDVSGITATLTGTVDAVGALHFAHADMSFPAFATTVLGLPATIDPEATTDWSGTIDPASGLVVITGGLTTFATVVPLVADCPVGPITLNLSTANAGGVAYDLGTGSATLTDATFAIGAIAPGTCTGEALINDALALPTAPGAAALSVVVTVVPLLTGSTTTTNEATTTTGAPATTTTGAPATTTTGAPATTTTGAPATTTTGAPATTTTTTVVASQATTTTTTASATATTSASAQSQAATTTTPAMGGLQQALPRTGGSRAAGWLALGLGLLSLGSALLVVRRRPLR